MIIDVVNASRSGRATVGHVLGWDGGGRGGGMNTDKIGLEPFLHAIRSTRDTYDQHQRYIRQSSLLWLRSDGLRGIQQHHKSRRQDSDERVYILNIGCILP